MANKRNKKQPLKRTEGIKKTEGKKKASKAATKPKVMVEKVAGIVKKGKQNAVAATPSGGGVEKAVPKGKETSLVEENAEEAAIAASSSSE